MTNEIDRRLAKLETQATTRSTTVPGWIAVPSLDDMTDDQRSLAIRHRLTVYVGVSPDDWDVDGAIP